MRLTNPHQVNISNALCLRNKPEEVGKHFIIFFDDETGVAKLIDEHWMVVGYRSITSPELFYLGEYL